MRRARPVRVDLPRRDLVGIEVDRRVRIDVGVAPDAAVGGPEARHRAHHPLVGALEPVARRLVAQRRLEPHVAVPHLDRVALVVEQPHQAGMGDRDVVALEVVVGDDLPVRRLRGGRLAEARRGARSRTARAAPRGPSRPSASGAASRSRLTNTRPAKRLDARRHQAERGLVEAREAAPLGHADQACRRCGRSSRGTGSAAPCRSRRGPRAGARRGGGRRCGTRAARRPRRARRAPTRRRPAR